MSLEGTLHDIPLVDLLEIFEIGNKTGLLVLSCGEQRGQLTVSGGLPIDAAILGDRQQLLAADDEALVRMLLWDDGAFEFHHNQAAAIRPLRITMRTPELIRESERRREQASRPEIHIGTRLTLASAPTDQSRIASLGLDEWRLLAALATGNTLGEACLEAGLIPARALDLADALLRIDLVQPVLGSAASSTSAAAPVAPPPAPPIARSPDRWAPANGALPASGGTSAPKSGAAPAPATSGVANSSLLKAIIRRVRAI